MDFSERKRKIIDFIRSYGSISNSDAQSITMSHRNTISSDFRKLVKEGLLIPSGEGKGTRYELKENLIFKNDYIESIFPKREKLSLDNYLKTINRKKAFFNKTSEKALNADFSFSGDVDKAFLLMKTKIADKRKTLSDNERKRKKEKLVIDLSWASSNIEGNTYSLVETEALIKYSQTAMGKSIDEAQMILNHKTAINFIRNSKGYKKLNKRAIFELHQILTQNLNVDTGIRKHLVAISNSSHVPCDNEFQINSFFEDIINQINSKRSILEKSVAANLLVAYLQPFGDGNKRTSRMLGNAILLSNDYIPISFVNTPKADYIKAILYFYEKQNPNFFKKLFLQELNNSYKDYIE